MRVLFMLARLEVDSNEFILDVALFGYQGHAACAGGHRGSVKFECHGGNYRSTASRVCWMWVSNGGGSPDYLYPQFAID